jgi:hypothetical protein
VPQLLTWPRVYYAIEEIEISCQIFITKNPIDRVPLNLWKNKEADHSICLTLLILLLELNRDRPDGFIVMAVDLVEIAQRAVEHHYYLIHVGHIDGQVQIL